MQFIKNLGITKSKYDLLYRAKSPISTLQRWVFAPHVLMVAPFISAVRIELFRMCE